MMTIQWMLARPEMKEFLRGRYMVPYQEDWMGAVDSMKKLQGWTDTTITHYFELAVTGERILLSIRYGDWSDIENIEDQAKNWARSCKPEIQRYLYAYKTVTGVDLAGDIVDSSRCGDAVSATFHAASAQANRTDDADRLAAPHPGFGCPLTECRLKPNCLGLAGKIACFRGNLGTGRTGDHAQASTSALYLGIVTPSVAAPMGAANDGPASGARRSAGGRSRGEDPRGWCAASGPS